MTILTTMKRKFLAFATWVEGAWTSVVVVMTLGVMFCGISLFISWEVGFWLNGLYGYHFDLGSCWAGVGVLGTSMLTIASMAGVLWGKYHTDSALNSKTGAPPECLKKVRDIIK